MRFGVATLGATLLAGTLFVATGCSGAERAKPAAAAEARASTCPKAWRPAWQKLANRIRAPVYCPSWMPNPLTGEIGGPWDNGVSVTRTRSYLVSFVWHEAQSGDVHVNFRGYPGRTRIPVCIDVKLGGGTVRRTKIPCFADPRGQRRAGSILATVYTVNQDADQWHVLYAWRRKGSLYTISEHVIAPLTFRKVMGNLDRLLRGLGLIEPQTAS